MIYLLTGVVLILLIWGLRNEERERRIIEGRDNNCLVCGGWGTVPHQNGDDWCPGCGGRGTR